MKIGHQDDTVRKTKKHAIRHQKHSCLFMHLFWHHAFSCVFSNHETICKCDCLAYIQEVLSQPRKVHSKIDISCILKLRAIMCLFLHCAFSCASLTDQTFCRSSYNVCKQTVSRRCVKACDTSNHLIDYMSSCTACIQKAFLQYV